MASGPGNGASSDNSDEPLQLPWSPDVQGPMPAAVEAVVGFGFPLSLVLRVYLHLLSVRLPPPHAHRAEAAGNGSQVTGRGSSDWNGPGITLTAATLLTAVDDALRHSEHSSFANDGIQDGAHWTGDFTSPEGERGGALTDGGPRAESKVSPTSDSLQGDGSRGGDVSMVGSGETTSPTCQSDERGQAGDTTSNGDRASDADALRASGEMASSSNTTSDADNTDRARDAERGTSTECDRFTERSSGTESSGDIASDSDAARYNDTARDRDTASVGSNGRPGPPVSSSETSSHYGGNLSTDTAPSSLPVRGSSSKATSTTSPTPTPTPTPPKTTAAITPAATLVAACSLASSTVNASSATTSASSSWTAAEGGEPRDRDSEATEQRARKRMRQLQKLRILRAENKRLKDRSLCQHCRERPVSLTLLPCGHFCFCQECGATFNACPVCRKTILADVKTYVS